MNIWVILFRVIILMIGILVLSFDALLYNLFERQRIQFNALNDQQKIEVQVNSNKFKYQEQHIYYLGKDLHDAQQQIKDQTNSLAEEKDALEAQKDALLQEIEKRQQIGNESKNIQTALVDIKAEADAIKQDMKGWQKDYVSVLAELEKKMDDSQDEIKNLKDDLDSFEKTTQPPPDNSISTAQPVTDTNAQQPQDEIKS